MRGVRVPRSGDATIGLAISPAGDAEPSPLLPSLGVSSLDLEGEEFLLVRILADWWRLAFREPAATGKGAARHEVFPLFSSASGVSIQKVERVRSGMSGGGTPQDGRPSASPERQ